MSVVREFYANLASHVVKKVRVRGVLVDFNAESINSYYSLAHVPSEPFDRLYEHPDYPEVIRVLTNGRGEWKLNSEGHAVHFKAKHLAFIPKVWHHFSTSRLIPTTNVCEVTAKRALLNYAIIQDIPFDVGQVIEDALLHNRDAKMNSGHPFLIYGLCKIVGVPLDDNEEWLHPIKTISVKRDKPSVPRPEGVYDSGHEPLGEDELHDYRARFGLLGNPQEDIGQSSSHPPPPPPQPTTEAAPSSPHPTSRTRCSPLLSALMHSGTRPRSTESSSHRIWRRFALMCVRCWPTRPLFFSSSSPSRLSLLSSLHSIIRHRHRHHRSDPTITRGVLFPLSCSFIASGDTRYFYLGGGGVSGDRVFVRLVLFCFDFRISAVVYFYLCMLVYIFA